MPTRSAVWVLWIVCAAGCVPTVPPELTLNRERLNFGDVEIGGTYRLGVVLSNPGTLVLRMKELRLEPPLPELQLEGLPIDEIAPESWEGLTVVYRPATEGTLSASVLFEAADGKGPRQLPLEGRVVQLSATIQAEAGASCAGQPGSLDFGTVFNGDGGIRTFTVQSTGTGTISLRKGITSPENAGFTVEGTPLALAPGTSGTFTVRYDPTLAGPQVGAVTLLTNSVVMPRISVPICATGMVSALCVTPAVFSFGDVAPGASAAGQLTVSSCGNLPATLQSATIVPDPTAASGFRFNPAPVLPAVLAAGESATLDVRFDSTARRTARSQLRLVSSSRVTPQLLVPLGANLPPPCDANLSLASLSFYKDLSPTKTMRVTNSGANDCVIERMDIVPPGSDFSVVRALVLPAVLAARSSMEFDIHYGPPSTATVPTDAKLQLELDWVHEVPLHGDPRPPPGCHLIPMTPGIDFGFTSGTGRASKTLVLSNIGSGSCTLSAVTFDVPGFTVVYPSTPIPGQSQTFLTVSYVTPPTATARMTISSNDLDQPLLDLPILIGHIRCDPNCHCTADQTPTYWRFSPGVGSAVTPSTGNLGAFQESCDPRRCGPGQVSVELDRGVMQCMTPPPVCSGEQGLELSNGEQWACVPCPLLVQYGGLYSGQRACASVPQLSCGSSLAPTFDAKLRVWRCVETCNNGAYDQRTLGDGTLVCVPC